MRTPHVILLGTGAALSDGARTTTMLGVRYRKRTIVVDCGGDVIQRLLAGGIDLESVDAMIITHEHADHTSGFPLFMERLWLSGRDRPIPVYGPQAGLSQARRCFETFDTGGWDGIPEIEWREINPGPRETVLADDTWQIVASPGVHGVPVVGLRFDFPEEQRSLTYSSDTAPCDSIIELAMNCDLLLHEASGDFKGHTSVRQAAEVAREAGARKLVLVHLPPHPDENELETAREFFDDMVYGTDLESFVV